MQNKMRIIITSVIALLMAILLIFSASANGIGDVNGDGTINTTDARLALRAAVGLENFAVGSPEFLACDVNMDNNISTTDARLILRVAVGLETFGTTAAPEPKPEPKPEPPTKTEEIWGYNANSTVYVSRANKIHRISDCSGMKYYTEMTLTEAIEINGYVKCKNCW